MSERDEVVCGTHGSTPTTYACRHVVSGIACGFHADESDPTDRWPDAWCDACEELRLADGGWTDESTAAVIRILCTHCWESARARNERVPDLARGAAARLTDDEQDRFGHATIHEVQRLQDVADATWGFTRLPRWYFDRDARTVTFGDHLVADVRLVGSYSTRSSTFQWSWATLDHDDPIVDGLATLRTFGEVRGISRLTDESWSCDLGDGWGMTAIAGYLLGCDAVYRAPFDHLYWFMLLRNFRELA